MDFHYKQDYSKFSDKQIVEKILADPHDEEAATYLLHERYSLLLRNLYFSITKSDVWYMDCVDELFMHMKGKDGSWHYLAVFEWRSTFGYWLKKVALFKFREVLSKLVENQGQNISIDDIEQEKPKGHVSVESETIEHRMRKVMLLEAIAKLKDDNQRFVILKRLEGYNSREIAMLLQKKWEERGIEKYNNQHERVIPDVGYVDVHTQRAKRELKKMMSNYN